jgi:3-hydroxyisobutyrate dehydrogenase
MLSASRTLLPRLHLLTVSAVRGMSSSSAAATSTSTSPSPSFQLLPGRTRIGWIGIGVMGSSMCAHILKAASPQYPTSVYNRTASKAAPLQALGAVWVGSPEEVADASDIVFSIVGYPADVRSVYLGDGSGQREGVLARLRPGAVIVDLTTSEPSLAVEIARAAAAKGIAALDAPVSGGDVGARNATLSIMVGCDDVAAFDAVLPLLQCMGKNINRCGGAGAGQHTKMVCTPTPASPITRALRLGPAIED